MLNKNEYIRRRLQMLCATCNRIVRVKARLQEVLPEYGLLEDFDKVYRMIIEEEL